MKFTPRFPNVDREIARQKQRYLRDRREAELFATDKGATVMARGTQNKIRSVGLGKLAQGVGHTSSLKKRDRTGQPYGVMYARGGDESRGGKTLEAYSRGAYITAKRGKWLAISTGAIPKMISAGGRRRRITPELYRQSSLMTSLGPLQFVQQSLNRAVLIAKNVAVSPKTGRAKRATGRERSLVRQKSVVAFVLIRSTSRAQRFDKDDQARIAHGQMPEFLGEGFARVAQRRTIG